MKSEEDLPHFVIFQGKPEYETMAKKFESSLKSFSYTQK